MHKNSLDNEELHHLYEIFDTEENEVFKYGISCELIDDDGQSKRMRRQVKFLNPAAGWLRYFAKILLTGIPRRLRAEEIEDEYMATFEAERGRMPRGNLKRNRKRG